MPSLRTLPLLACAALLSLLALVCMPIAAVSGAHAFNAYRLVQYDRGSTPFGSRRTTLNHQAQVPTREELATATADDEWSEASDDEAALEEEAAPDGEEGAAPKATAQDLSRRVLVVRIQDLSPSRVRNLVSRGALGVLIVLPKDLSALSAAQIARFKQLEQYLATRNWDAAIYFAFDDEYLHSMIDNLHFSLEGGQHQPAVKLGGVTNPLDRYHIQVTTPDAQPLSGVQVHNFHGWQHAAASATADSDTLPTLAIVASYDTLGAVPGLAYGLDQNGSGAIAVLELARIFSKLYSDFRSHGSVNVLFILTALDRINHVATKNWLRNIDSRVLESMEFALCLERIATPVAAGADAPLYLHVSKMPKTPEIQSLYANFETTASQLHIPFEVVHRKINISNPTVYWQHEQFSRKRVVAATLSASRTPQTVWENGGSIFDGGNNVDQAVDLRVLERNIKFIVEALAKHIYQIKPVAAGGAVTPSSPVEVLNGTQGINTHFLRAYMGLFAASPRFTPYGLSSADGKLQQPALAAIESHLNKFTLDVKKQTFNLEQITSGALGGAPGALKFYRDKDGGVDAANPRLGVVEMHAFQVKPFLFDVYFTAAILGYLLVVYILCKQPENISDVIAVLIGR